MTTSTHQKRKYNARTESEWRSLIDAYKTSPLAQKVFFAKHDIAPSAFHRWRHRFAKEQPPEKQDRFIEIPFPPAADPSSVHSGTPPDQWSVELELGEKCILRIRVA